MKHPVCGLFLLATFPLQALAGYYGYASIDTYEPVTGHYYKSIEIEKERNGFLSKGPSTQTVNIAIFDPQTEKHTFIFKEDRKRTISFILYETGVSDGVVAFYSSGHSQSIKNNYAIAARKPKDRLLIGVQSEKDGNTLTELWDAKKNGDKLKRLTIVPSSHTWHIDVRNSKIRIVASAGNGKFSIKSIDW